MESEKSNPTTKDAIFRLFDDKPTSGLGFLDFPEKPLPPPPPCREVLPSEVSADVKCSMESLDVAGLTLLKGKVSTKEVFAVSNSDLVPGKYEGGLKLWEGSSDLIEALSLEMQDGKLSFTGKRVLELGCGHGLPGIFACLKAAEAVHFQDFNAEVLQCLTIPNVTANIEKEGRINTDTRFFSGDWAEVHNVLDKEARYDVILMAETVYSISSLPILYTLIKKCLRSPHGVVYTAAKKYYFGVGEDQGGSSLSWKKMVFLHLLWLRSLQMVRLMFERFGSFISNELPVPNRVEFGYSHAYYIIRLR